jgi:hypothetical protein
LTLPRTVDRYVLDMRAWLTLRPMVGVPWCEVRYEDAVADLAGQARRMLTTLGLSWDNRVIDYRHRLRDKPVTSPTYEDVPRLVYSRSVGRWRRYEKYLEPLMDGLRPYLDEFGYA